MDTVWISINRSTNILAEPTVAHAYTLKSRRNSKFKANKQTAKSIGRLYLSHRSLTGQHASSHMAAIVTAAGGSAAKVGTVHRLDGRAVRRGEVSRVKAGIVQDSLTEVAAHAGDQFEVGVRQISTMEVGVLGVGGRQLCVLHVGVVELCCVHVRLGHVGMAHVRMVEQGVAEVADEDRMREVGMREVGIGHVAFQAAVGQVTVLVVLISGEAAPICGKAAAANHILMSERGGGTSLWGRGQRGGGMEGEEGGIWREGRIPSERTLY